MKYTYQKQMNTSKLSFPLDIEFLLYFEGNAKIKNKITKSKTRWAL